MTIIKVLAVAGAAFLLAGCDDESVIISDVQGQDIETQSLAPGYYESTTSKGVPDNQFRLTLSESNVAELVIRTEDDGALIGYTTVSNRSEGLSGTFTVRDKRNWHQKLKLEIRNLSAGQGQFEISNEFGFRETGFVRHTQNSLFPFTREILTHQFVDVQTGLMRYDGNNTISFESQAGCAIEAEIRDSKIGSGVSNSRVAFDFVVKASSCDYDKYSVGVILVQTNDSKEMLYLSGSQVNHPIIFEGYNFK